MVTESFQEYKGYLIRLRAVTYNGFWYAIIKEVPNTKSPNGIKKLYLKQQGYNFIKPNDLLKKAIDYIDNHEINLINKYNKLQLNNFVKH